MTTWAELQSMGISGTGLTFSFVALSFTVVLATVKSCSTDIATSFSSGATKLFKLVLAAETINDFCFLAWLAATFVALLCTLVLQTVEQFAALLFATKFVL
jgi:hypothetical protein